MNRTDTRSTVFCHVLSSAILLTTAMLFAGCEKDDQIRTYQAPKDQVVQTQPDAAPHSSEPPPLPAGAALPNQAAPQSLSWTVPDGWKATEGNSMTAAAFAVSDANPQVKCTVTPLALIPNAVQSNVNRWEGQLGLPPTEPKDMVKKIKPVQVGDQLVNVVDLQSDKLQMLGAIIERDQLWFIKLAGPKEVVSAQTEKFDAFIKSLKFTDQPTAPAGAQMNPPANPQPGGEALPANTPKTPVDPHANLPMPAGNPQAPAAPAADRGVTWDLPAGWAEAANPSPMRVATIKAGDAEVIASRLSAQGWGNLIDNINRWRGQTGLEPIDDVSKQPSSITETNGLKWTTYDLTGPQKRMMVSYVTNGESVWFFRMGGTAPAVEAQKAGFDSFVKSIKFQ